MRLARSFLYVPGNRPALFEKADAGAVDALILDLEDAVPLAEKPRARAELSGWLRQRAPGKPVWVRVNPGREGEEDLDALAGVPGIAGLVLAKSDRAGVSATIDGARRRGIVAPLSPLLETPGAVLDAPAIAGIPGVAFLQLGEYDLAAEIGASPSPGEPGLAFARSQLVFASAAAGLAPPPAPVSVEIADLRAFEESTRALAASGFVGRACIHPAQVGVVNAVFTPGEAEVAAARASLAAFEAAVATGAGVTVDDAGRMIDEATIRHARRVLALAEAEGER